ncbi:MAG: hypothetical protein CME63_10780 [Halobacteriovoraceae bacterium]|nr:hypothetical protein [Halobacteriovoraceae bacterium]MBC98227.1 hypothetical protein [Halobacteriovoraceae bacterium]|tara:strand:+ start:126869 stop:127378 length:510 start_codon:yes stop_codon:yes gene_type:complete
MKKLDLFDSDDSNEVSEIYDEHYILYIQWSEKLDPAFIRFAAEFKKFKINLIPIKANELDYFLEKRQIPVILMTPSLGEYQKYKSVRKKCFDFYVKNRKIKLFHLSSFSMDHDFISSSRRRSYVHIPLPIEFSKATLLVLSHYLEDVEGDKKWPGGKRSKLPSLGSSEA